MIGCAVCPTTPLDGRCTPTSGWVYPAVPAHRVATSLEAQWKKLERGEPLTVEERADSWLSRTNAFRTGRDVVALLYDTIGAGAIYSEKSPFDRHLRDLQTACQHLVSQTKGWEGIGPMVLGGEPAFPFI